jgi:hypothetical protein
MKRLWISNFELRIEKRAAGLATSVAMSCVSSRLARSDGSTNTDMMKSAQSQFAIRNSQFEIAGKT